MNGHRSSAIPSWCRGGVVVEAAYAIPVFLMTFFAAAYVLVLAYRAVTLQFVVGELARDIGIRPGVPVTLAEVQAYAGPYLGTISGFQFIPATLPNPPPPGSIFTLALVSTTPLPIVGGFTLQASAVGVMERM